MQRVNLRIGFHVFWQTSAVSVDDYGRDLAGIQALQRKQEDIEQDMMALFQQLQVAQCTVLCRSVQNEYHTLSCYQLNCSISVNFSA